MRKLVWRFNYSRYMSKLSKCGWCHAWYCSGVAASDGGWIDHDPEDLAYEEMTCWDE